MSARVAVLLSGRGSNFLALEEAIEAGQLPARIVVVVSDIPEARGLQRAREIGLNAVAVDRKGLGRRAHEERVLAVLREHDVNWVCLAGYMRLLSSRFVQAYPRRILNIHPSLLPAFPGLDAQRQALDHGVRVTGCTVHLVDENLDSGPIVSQRSVPVLDGDTEDDLSARILKEEHLAYAEALGRVLKEEWRIQGRSLIFGK